MYCEISAKIQTRNISYQYQSKDWRDWLIWEKLWILELKFTRNSDQEGLRKPDQNYSNDDWKAFQQNNSTSLDKCFYQVKTKIIKVHIRNTYFVNKNIGTINSLTKEIMHYLRGKSSNAKLSSGWKAMHSLQHHGRLCPKIF